MKLSALTYTFLIFAGGTGIIGFLAGSLHIIALTIGCILIPGLGIVTHLRTVKSDISSMKFSRIVSATFMRQNTRISVQTSIIGPIDQYQYRDLIPTGCRCIAGDPTFKNGTTTYDLLVPVAGNLQFEGINVTTSCRFGTFTFTLTNASAPLLHVSPFGTASLISEKEEWKKEGDSYRFISSDEIRDFHPYQLGDNIKDIDWKQTAKHDELFVRVRNTLEDNKPFIIIDIPELGCSHIDTFNAIANHVFANARRYEDVTVAFICGGELIEVAPLDDFSRIERNLMRAGKGIRNMAMYNERTRIDLRQTWESIVATDTYGTILHEIYGETMNRTEFGFEIIAKRLIISETGNRGILVSTGYGDTSHLRYLVQYGSLMLESISVYLAGKQNELVDILKQAGAQTVEVQA